MLFVEVKHFIVIKLEFFILQQFMKDWVLSQLLVILTHQLAVFVIIVLNIEIFVFLKQVFVMILLSPPVLVVVPQFFCKEVVILDCRVPMRWIFGFFSFARASIFHAWRPLHLSAVAAPASSSRLSFPSLATSTALSTFPHLLRHALGNFHQFRLSHIRTKTTFLHFRPKLCHFLIGKVGRRKAFHRLSNLVGRLQFLGFISRI
mmetsp:Transcript_12891/g.35681  ORF Transcript_12891/g.35681 Transcript_12891/m.35681 type:complete len:204 (-) Transcript_12891:240-851(-)